METLALNIDVVERDRVLTLVVEGDLDIATAPLLDEQLAAAEAKDIAALVVDLDRVEFMDSSGLHVLLRHVAYSSQNGNRLRLTNGSAQVQRLFEISGMSEHLPFLAG
jgi:anti-sigma B factor antagonist